MMRFRVIGSLCVQIKLFIHHESIETMPCIFIYNISPFLLVLLLHAVIHINLVAFNVWSVDKSYFMEESGGKVVHRQQ